MRASFHFPSQESAIDTLKRMIGDIENLGDATVDFIDEESVSGEPLRLEFINEANDEFDMPTGSIEKGL